jgi:hypothetical protein
VGRVLVLSGVRRLDARRGTGCNSLPCVQAQPRQVCLSTRGVASSQALNRPHHSPTRAQHTPPHTRLKNSAQKSLERYSVNVDAPGEAPAPLHLAARGSRLSLKKFQNLAKLSGQIRYEKPKNCNLAAKARGIVHCAGLHLLRDGLLHVREVLVISRKPACRRTSSACANVKSDLECHFSFIATCVYSLAVWAWMESLDRTFG